MIKLWHCIRLSVCVILKLWSFRYSWTWFVITLSDSDVCDECCELNVTVNGDRWTYYDLGCMYELWFEIVRDFTDYRDYMGLSLIVWLPKWSLLGLISYNLGGSVTVILIKFYIWSNANLFTWKSFKHWILNFERIHSHTLVFRTLDGVD